MSHRKDKHVSLRKLNKNETKSSKRSKAFNMNSTDEQKIRKHAALSDELDIDLSDLTPAEVRYLKSNQTLVNNILIATIASSIVSYEDASDNDRAMIEKLWPTVKSDIPKIKPQLVEVIDDFESGSLLRTIKAPFKLQKLGKMLGKAMPQL